MIKHFIAACAIACMAGAASVAVAQETAAPGQGAPAKDPRFAQFAPEPETLASRIDYSIWDEALSSFVFRMGRSLRETPPSPEPGLGSRHIYGHDSLYRLEGNRVIFSYMPKEVVASFTEYREDLERTANEVDISRLDRNEQLAFWLNLHNVAVIEQIAKAYPISQPRQIKLGGAKTSIDETPFITIRGVKMSPRDIREKIVFVNWKDPVVIYGFFRGEIGGPSIQPEAFTGRNVGEVLAASAREFVNSLRGVQKSGETLKVSDIYDEARPYYFADWPAALRKHLLAYARTEVTDLIGKTTDVRSGIYEYDIADLAKGERDPNYGFVVSEDENGDLKPRSTHIPANIARLLGEHQKKVEKLIRHKLRVGQVIVLDVTLPGDEEVDHEVK